MRYFSYCPMDMEQDEALKRAKPHLMDHAVVDVRLTGYAVLPFKPGARLRAMQDRYLVRVEPDGSTRLVDRNIGD